MATGGSLYPLTDAGVREKADNFGTILDKEETPGVVIGRASTAARSCTAPTRICTSTSGSTAGQIDRHASYRRILEAIGRSSRLRTSAT